jgi:hypothetical protein
MPRMRSPGLSAGPLGRAAGDRVDDGRDDAGGVGDLDADADDRADGAGGQLVELARAQQHVHRVVADLVEAGEGALGRAGVQRRRRSTGSTYLSSINFNVSANTALAFGMVSTSARCSSVGGLAGLLVGAPATTGVAASWASASSGSWAS